MFRRRDSQKPPDELYASFKATWNSGHLVTTGPPSSALEVTHVSASILNASVDAQHFADLSDGKDLDLTPRAHLEDWKYSHNAGDQHASTYAGFYNPFHGVFTPTPGGTALYHNQATADMHAPGIGFGIGTPVSHSNSASGVFHEQSPLNLPDAHLLSMSPRHFQHTPSFGGNPPFSSSSFTHDLAAFDHGPPIHEPSSSHLAANFAEGENLHILSPPRGQEKLAAHMRNDQFRFQVSLNAATAMVKTPDEVPITYLNKGQAYSLSVADSLHRSSHHGTTKYRTFVRISFEDEQQRVKPGPCWQLWKEGRGMNEAHLRNGKLQAVEYVETSQGDPENKPYGPHVVSESFDGFCVTWASQPNGSAECSLAVRFNFLSTDFSHSKGVKGIPVRLCTKTEVLGTASSDRYENVPMQELCYCKVKLFRDHGAERKLANDIAHVKKTMEKLKQQIVQLESGGKDSGKRKRTSSTAGFPNSSRPAKAIKHKRSDSTSSDSSGGVQLSPEDDLHLRLASLQAMFTSTSPISLLSLHGETEDDPDLYPVSLPDLPPALPTGSSHDSAPKSTAPLISPSPSYPSATTEHRDLKTTGSAPPVELSRVSSAEASAGQKPVGLEQRKMKSPASPEVPLKIQLPTTGSAGTEVDFIQVIDIDPSYAPPPKLKVKPVACFYVKHKPSINANFDDYYRAVYLRERTVSEFILAVASKFGLDREAITGAVWINKAGINVRVDDEVIQEFTEGQDMTVHCAKQETHKTWNLLDTDLGDEETTEEIAHLSDSGFELILRA